MSKSPKMKKGVHDAAQGATTLETTPQGSPSPSDAAKITTGRGGDMSASAEVSEADRRIAIEAAGREHALQLVEALQSAFKTLDRRAQTRQKWTLWDQQAFEKVEAALVTVGAELPI